MRRDQARNKLRFPDAQAWQSMKNLVHAHVFRRQRIRISFDIDDTLACHFLHTESEQSLLPGVVQRWLGEPLRSGTRDLIRELRRRDCSIWIYTSSGRTPSYIRRWLLLYGVHIDGVVNSVRHSHALKVHGFANSPSKFPPAFGIDLHVDDSEGVRTEGYDHGFRVLVVRPDNENWAQQVLEAAADVQAHLIRHDLASRKGQADIRSEVFSS